MASTKFFHQLKVPIATTLGLRAPKRNQDKAEIPITFRIALDGNNVRSAPPFVRSAYDEIQNGANSVSLKKELENVNVELYNLPENKRASFRLARIHLQRMAVKEVRNSEGDATTVLSFETVYPWDREIWSYLGDHYATTVFTRFDSAQASLLDEEELQEGEDEPAEEPTAEVQ